MGIPNVLWLDLELQSSCSSFKCCVSCGMWIIHTWNNWLSKGWIFLNFSPVLVVYKTFGFWTGILMLWTFLPFLVSFLRLFISSSKSEFLMAVWSTGNSIQHPNHQFINFPKVPAFMAKILVEFSCFMYGMDRWLESTFEPGGQILFILKPVCQSSIFCYSTPSHLLFCFLCLNSSSWVVTTLFSDLGIYRLKVSCVLL